jgi:hypothetical protein
MTRILYVSHDIGEPRGGIGVVYDHVATLRAHGFEAFVVHGMPGFRYPFAPPEVPVIDGGVKLAIRNTDIVVVPEDYAEVIRNCRDLKCRRVLFCQNHHFIFDGLARGEAWRDYGFSEYICVSAPIQQALKRWFAISASIVRPAVDDAFFAREFKPLALPMTLACMPRKGRSNLRLVHGLLAAKGLLRPGRLSWLEIEGLAKAEVAARLRDAHIYVSTSVREGLGLPPLEAMGTGCLVVGFAGGGGLDYATEDNGLWVPDEDPWALAAALEQVATALDDPAAMASLDSKRRAGRATAQRYSRASFERELVTFWSAQVARG